MTKKTTKRLLDDTMSPRVKALLLTVMGIVGVGAVGVAIFSIVFMPRANPGVQRGVGANGFQAFVEDDSDLGIGKVVSQKDVQDALGKKAKAVSSASISKVFNFNGDRGQTATYEFVRADGGKASAYVDLMQFKSQKDFDATKVTEGTITAGTIKNRSAYYIHAQTLGYTREYRLMVIDGLKVYKFVVVQPSNNITIDEVAALAAMKKLAAKALFD